MSKESVIYIDAESAETARVALVEDGRLIEFHVEHAAERRIVGNIYKGVVANVLHGMQAAFVNIGLEHNAFLYAGDTIIDRSDLPAVGVIPDKLSLSPGDTVMVQATKEETETKGARLTCNISIAGRLAVINPTLKFIGVSHKIKDQKARARLEKIFSETPAARNAGFIVRTVAQHATKKEISAEIKELAARWGKIGQDYAKTPPGGMVHSEGGLIFRAVRDLATPNVAKILVNDAGAYDEIKTSMTAFMSDYRDKLELYEGAADMFSAFGVSEQIDKLFSRKVLLKSGAYLIVDKTEALTVIDVNSGRYTGGQHLEETVYSVNMEAAEEIAHTLRCRNIGGIILVDFIDMSEPEHRENVLDKLSECLGRDRIRTKIMGMTQLGLVEITRKKTRNDIAYDFTEPCPYCAGEGQIYSAAFVTGKLRAGIKEIFRRHGPPAVTVTVHPAVRDYIFTGKLSPECQTIWANKKVYVAADINCHRSSYRIQIEKDAAGSNNGSKLLY